MAVVNPYASQDLLIAAANSERMSSIVSRDEKNPRPFARQVDAWWLAMLVGLEYGRTPLSGETTKFNDGGVLASDPWRITHLELLAVAEEGVDVLQRPAQVVRIATEYANSGFDWLFEKLTGEAEPTLTLTNSLGQILNEKNVGHS